MPRHLVDLIVSADSDRDLAGRFVVCSSVAFVCKDWFALVHETVSQRTLLSTDLAFANVRCARDTTAVDPPTRVHETHQGLVRAGLKIPRGAVLVHHAGPRPRLVSLDLDGCGRLIHGSADAVKAALTQCPRLQRLLFSPNGWFYNLLRNDNPMIVLGDAVVAALPPWAAHGGFRSLHLDLRKYSCGFPRTNAYIEEISEYCPRLVDLRHFSVDGVESSDPEQWWLSIDVWEQFGRRCSDIESFNWLPLPFATAYFEVFGRYRHDKLQTLTIAALSYGNWTQFLTAADSITQSAVQGRGYGSLAVKPGAAVKGCPNLRRLRIYWRATVPPDTRIDLSTFVMNAEIFGDDFYEAVAANCKYLESISATSVDRGVRESIMTLTDRSLRALATLPFLQELKLEGASVSADGIFDLLRMHTPATTTQREYESLVDDSANTHALSMVVKAFLQRMVDNQEELQWPKNQRL